MSHPHFTRWSTAEGYAARQSVVAGETVDVHCSSRVPDVRVEVARLGVERTPVWSAKVTVDDHPVPQAAWRDGCDWPVAFTVPTEVGWRPGMYEIRLTAGAGDRAEDSSQAFVVVRHPGPHRPQQLVVLSTNTWQAYNQWGGRCLYSGADEVSFRRPIERGYITRTIDGDGYDGRMATTGDHDPEHHQLQRYLADHRIPLWTASSGWFNWERRFVEWAEGRGIELDFAVDADLDATVSDDTHLLDGRALLFTLGHNEYWSSGMRDTVDGFVETGGNWAILSGNTCFWQVRYSGDAASMICHKANARRADPVVDGQPQFLTSMWSDPLIGRPESSTIGLSFTRGGYHRVGQAMPRGSGGYTVEAPEHWVFAGTGLRYGDTVGTSTSTVGYEVDGCAMRVVGGRLEPTGEDGAPSSLEILATAPAHLISINADQCEAPTALWASVDPPGDLEWVAATLYGDDSPANTDRLTRGHAVMAVFNRGSGTVFNAGSANWCYGLGADPLVEQITANVIDRLGT
jgi:hypothetical protein